MRIGIRKTMDLTRVHFDSKADRYWEDMYATLPSNHHALLLQRRRQAVIDLVGANGGTTLELGCGPGVFFPVLPNALPYVVADLSRSMVRLAIGRGKGRVCGGVQLSAERLPIPASSFDLVIAIGVLEYLAEIGESLAEIHRILRVGGIAVISFPSPQPWGEMARWLGRPVESIVRSFLGYSLSPEDKNSRGLCHHRYSATAINRILPAVGFEIEKRFSFHYFYFPFDTLFFQTSKRVNQFLERFALTAPLLHTMAQSHLWRVRKLRGGQK